MSKPLESIARNKSQAKACAEAIFEARQAVYGCEESIDRKLYELEMQFWRLADEHPSSQQRATK